MSHFKDLVFQMFDKMDDDFKKQNEVTIRSHFEQYPIVYLMKDDLLGYLKQNYHRKYIDENIKEKMKQHIENYDDYEMQYVAKKLAQDPMMDSFWIGIDCWLDKILDELPFEDDDSDSKNE
jgi:predicted alpha/beta-fold hydrolase